LCLKTTAVVIGKVRLLQFAGNSPKLFAQFIKSITHCTNVALYKLYRHNTFSSFLYQIIGHPRIALVR